MVTLFPRLRIKARTPRRSLARPGETALMPPAAAQADHIRQRQPEEPGSRTVGRGLRCLWYDAGLADMLTMVDEFLRTPAATAALVEFYRTRHGSPAPESDTRMLIDAFGVTAARLRA